MSFLDAFEVSTRADPDLAEKTVPRGFGERFDLEWKAARAPDKWGYYESRMRDLWDDALERLNKATGQRLTNPFALPPENLTRFDLGGPGPAAAIRTIFGTREKAMGAATDAFDEALAGQHDLPNPRLFEDKIRAEATKLRQDAAQAALAGYGASGLGAFLGAASGELSHPVNLATLPIGGAYASANIARVGLLRYIGRAALAESAVAAASQTAIEIADAPYQERLGTDTGIEDRLERIFIAGAGGAIFGMGLSGLVAAARGLKKKLSPTLDEADALKFAERASLHEGKNPLGPEGVTAHARAVETAERQVAAGQHADVDQIVREEVQRQTMTVTEATRRLVDLEDTLLVQRNAAKAEAEAATARKDPNAETLWGRFEALNDQWKAAAKAVPDIGAPRAEGASPSGTRADPAAPLDPKYRDTLAAIRDAEDLGEEVTAKWLASATGVTAKQAEKTIARLQKDGILGEADAAGAFPVDIGRVNSKLLPDAAPAPALDPATITRAIADSAPPVPEKAAATAKAEMDLANAKAIAEGVRYADAPPPLSAEDAARGRATRADFKSLHAMEGQNAFVVDAQGGLWRAADGHEFFIDELMRARGFSEAQIKDSANVRRFLDDAGLAQITMFSSGSGGRISVGFSVGEKVTKEQVTAARRILAEVKKSGAEVKEFQVSAQKTADGTVKSASGDEGMRLLERAVPDTAIVRDIGTIKVDEKGPEMSAKEALDASSEAVKEANFFVKCAMGVAIG